MTLVNDMSMRNNLRANVELGAQIAIAIAVVVVAGMLVKRSLFPQQPNPTSVARINAGEQLIIPNVDWERNKKSLVFFLKKDCVYCASSAPFYRQIIEDASKRKVTLLAILPSSVDEARQYVQSLQLPIENLQTGSLSSYKIPGTPTVLFVDSRGIVRTVWFGAPRDRETEMRDQLVKLFDE